MVLLLVLSSGCVCTPGGPRTPADCASISGLEERDECYWRVGGFMRDPSVCENVVDDVVRRLCYAVSKLDASECDRIETQPQSDWCYFGVASGSGNKTLCGRIRDAKDREDCGRLDDTQRSKTLAEQRNVELVRKNCLNYSAGELSRLRNHSFGEWNEADMLVYNCTINLAASEGNLEICNAVVNLTSPTSNTNVADECAMLAAVRTGNISFCGKLWMPKDIGFCKAMINRDWSECRRIECGESLIACNVMPMTYQKDLCTQRYIVETGERGLCPEVKNEPFRGQCMKWAAENAKTK